MSDLLREFDNSEAILMMYLAEELSPPARLEVEHRLQRDPALRRQLEQLRSQLQRTADDFAAEAAHATALNVEAAAERLRPVMRQWAVQRLVRPVAPAPSAVRRRPAPWFVYPLLGTAAALVLVALVLSQLEPTKQTAPHALAYNYSPNWQESAAPEPATPQAALSPQAQLLVETMSDSDPLNSVANDTLARATTELGAIRQLADSMEQGEDTSLQ